MVCARMETPLGPMAALAEGDCLTGLWFEGQKHFALPENVPIDPAHPVLQMTRAWVEAYFAQKPLPGMPALAPRGTDFQQRVWRMLREIPCGQTTTYGELAKALRSSPRAVGSAVGRNPISLLIPCHRVVGAGGQLTGYAGGLDRKQYLLQLESKSF